MLGVRSKKVANSPCGSTTVCTNCSRLRPMTSTISAPISSIRVETGSPTDRTVGADQTPQLRGRVLDVVPLPRRLRRWCFGVRWTRNMPWDWC